MPLLEAPSTVRAWWGAQGVAAARLFMSCLQDADDIRCAAHPLGGNTILWVDSFEPNEAIANTQCHTYPTALSGPARNAELGECSHRRRESP